MVKIGFSTTNSVVSKLIRWLDKSKASHVYLLYFDNDLGQEMVLEADFSSYRAISYEKFCKENIIVRVVLPRKDISVGLKEMAKWLGAPYDKSGLFGNLFVILGRWFRRKIRNPLGNAKGLLCTESVVLALQKAGYVGAQELVPDSTTVRDLWEFFDKDKS